MATKSKKKSGGKAKHVDISPFGSGCMGMLIVFAVVYGLISTLV